MANPFLVNGTASPQSIFSTVVGTPEHKVGTRGLMEDGRVFYYTRNSTAAALAPGKLLVRPVHVATSHHAECAATAGVAGTNTVTGITIGATAMTINQYRDGYLMVTDGTGEGHTYRIKEHAAFDASATTVAVTLYDNIAVTLASSPTVTFSYNGYADPIISPTTLVSIPVGVPNVNIPASTSTTDASTFVYGWIQTWGECALLQGEAISALGQALVADGSGGVAGAVDECDNVTTESQEFIVGRNISITVDTEYSATFLTIRP